MSYGFQVYVLCSLYREKSVVRLGSHGVSRGYSSQAGPLGTRDSLFLGVLYMSHIKVDALLEESISADSTFSQALLKLAEGVILVVGDGQEIIGADAQAVEALLENVVLLDGLIAWVSRKGRDGSMLALASGLAGTELAALLSLLLLVAAASGDGLGAHKRSSAGRHVGFGWCWC